MILHILLPAKKSFKKIAYLSPILRVVQLCKIFFFVRDPPERDLQEFCFTLFYNIQNKTKQKNKTKASSVYEIPTHTHLFIR